MLSIGRSIRPFVVTVIMACCLNTLTHADVLSGNVSSYIDGDTFVLNAENIRLNGIDAPEYSQKCKNESGKSYRCGVHAVDLRRGQVLGSLFWPSGNQIFALDWAPRQKLSGLPFSSRGSRERTKRLFYAYQI